MATHDARAGLGPRGKPRRLGKARAANAQPPPPPKGSKNYALQTRLRGEATAPFRTVRLFGFGSLMASAGLGLAINSIQLLAGASGAKGPDFNLTDALQSEAIDLGALLVLGLLFRNDLKARDRQLARLAREDSLAALPLRFSNGKVKQVGELRGVCRVVVVAGPPDLLAESVAAADAMRDELERRAVFVVPVPLADDEAGVIPAPDAEKDLRWRASIPASQLGPWREWLVEQASLANADITSSGCYLSLRMDGRVRGSGKSVTPWESLLILPTSDGFFKGALDFVDGEVEVGR